MPAPGDAVEPLGDVDAVDLQGGRPAGRDVQLLAAEAEAVLRVLVAVAGDGEEDRLVHQPRLVERDDAVAVGDEANPLLVRNSTSGTPRPVCASTTVIANGFSGSAAKRAVRRKVGSMK